LIAATSLAFGAWLMPALPSHAAPPPATDEQVAAAIAGAQNYLFVQFVDDGNGMGHWPDYNNLTGTSAAVAALVESGKMADPLYRERIEKGIAFIKSKVKPNGGIYEQYNESYETGMALVALALYGQATTTDAAYRTIVQNAVDFLRSYQNIEGSMRGGDYGPAGEATSTNPNGCDSSVSRYYGAWGYYPGDTNNDKCSTSGDLSNTQFVVMGLWYGSRYLGSPIDTAPWAKALLYFLKSQQQASGGFNVYPNSSDYSQRTGAASAMWSLAMIGQTTAKKDPSDTSTMVENAINWFATGTDQNDYYHPAAYTWNNESSAYMYFIYAMAKALTATIGPAGLVGTNNWALDMKTEVVNSQYRSSGTYPDNSAYDSWNSNGGLDPKAVGQTSWVLMSLAFASTSTPSTEKLLAQEELLDNIVRGLVTLHTTDGVTISAATRGNTAVANLGQNVVLPIGSISFTLNNVPVGGTAVLSIQPPAGALDPTLPSSFIEADGSLKAGLSWFKIVGADWKGLSSVPITIDRNLGVILVTLTDGGPEDADGVANGVIVDPGAPGFGDVPAVPVAWDDDSGFFGCSSGNGRPDPTLVLLLVGGIAFLLRRRRG
jgi:MYXO-CTERM domain-containing protein